MTADNRSVHTDALATLGTIIDDTQKRDAIHLAVIPMVATSRRLGVGAHINTEGVEVKPYSDTAVGIVDPFLRASVEPGERFWCVLYPRTITSLRHVWSHPAFSDSSEFSTSVEASRQWLAQFAQDLADSSLDDLLGAVEYATSGGRYADGSICMPNDLNQYGLEPTDEFWGHWSAVTGKPKPTNAPTGFRCAC